MQALAFDGRTGASGDMLLGALLAAGADPDALDPAEAALGVRYEVERVRKAGIAATRVRVTADGEPIEGRGPDRTLDEVEARVRDVPVPDPIAEDAVAVFQRLAEAEARVHDADVEETHFHEVGADDAVADVVGVAILVDDLDPDRIVTTPVAVGGGEVTMRHGTYPVPAPAVVELADGAGWSIHGGPVEEELLTPTGAALLAHFAEGVDSLPGMRVEASGYGAGSKDLDGRANVLRALLGEARGMTDEDVTVLETNLDDAPPEVLGGLQETLAEAGARDVSILPMTMKKSRPGHLVKVVTRPADAERVARRLAEETGTLGVREVGATHRWIAERRFVEATLSIDGERHRVAIKVGSAGGEAYDVSAEYDDAAAIARETGLPVREVLRRAEAAARDAGALAEVLVHVVEADRWDAVDDEYAPASLEREGFVHLSTPERAPGVAQAVLPDADDPRLVVIERERVENDLRYEETPAGAFPHLYAPLPTDAVLDVLPFPREGGRYRLPDDL